MTPDPADVLDLPDVAAWEAWLETHHETAPEAWVRITRKGSGAPGIIITEALESALCFGWIDGQRRSLDRVSFLQRYCPRRPRSTWSQANVAKVAALEAAGRMRPAGRRQVEAAQADGRWAAAYEGQRTAKVPADLLAALNADRDAALVFDGLNRTDRYAVILPVLRASTPETRAAAVRRQIDALRRSS